MDKESVTVKVGSIGDKLWNLSFQVALTVEDKWYLDIFAHDPINMRKAPILIRLTEHNYQSFKELIQKTDETIVQLRENRQQNQQKLMEQLRSLPTEQLSSLGINPEWLN
ncbi:hypothetical protein ACN4EK_22035 [Pantanalinema rosaneae CENA516]|uniref:hypothetical protein n=1 Tax=Pantanalinema rosaneae TaxID=1620701 RepID=UPI003D6ECC94